MKKTILIIALLAMLGWTVYQFVFPSDDPPMSQELSENTAKDKADRQDHIDQDTIQHEQRELEETERDEQENVGGRYKVGLEVGNIAPDFQLTVLNGEEAALSDYRGTRVLINFWATWCPPCRAEMPDMEQLYQEEDLEILAVNLTETEPSLHQVQQFVDEYELTFPILLDEVIKVANIYAIQPIPTSFIVDSKGIIQFKTFGPLTYDQMRQVLADID